MRTLIPNQRSLFDIPDDVVYLNCASHSPLLRKAFETGQRVFHQKFGYGRVVAVDGDKLDIQFEKAGAKKVIQSFVEAV